jgi:hypothetical protein
MHNTDINTVQGRQQKFDGNFMQNYIFKSVTTGTASRIHAQAYPYYDRAKAKVSLLQMYVFCKQLLEKQFWGKKYCSVFPSKEFSLFKIVHKKNQLFSKTREIIINICLLHTQA